MIFGAADIETGALILTMDAAQLESFVGEIRRSIPKDLELTARESRPMTRPVTHLSLRPEGDGPLFVAIDREAGTIGGGREAFARLADELSEFPRWNDLDEPGMHAHFESEGVELIVTGPVPDDLAG